MKKATIEMEDSLLPEYDLAKLTKVGRGLFAPGRNLSPATIRAINSGSSLDQATRGGVRKSAAVRSGRGRRSK